MKPVMSFVVECSPTDLVFAPMRGNATPKSGQWQISHDLQKNELVMMHRNLERKSAKSAYFAPRRSNRAKKTHRFMQEIHSLTSPWRVNVGTLLMANTILIPISLKVKHRFH
jgi:hypothetical protein